MNKRTEKQPEKVATLGDAILRVSLCFLRIRVRESQSDVVSAVSADARALQIAVGAAIPAAGANNSTSCPQ